MLLGYEVTYQLQFQPQVDLEQRGTAHRQLTGTEVVPRRGGFPVPLWVTCEASETQSWRGEVNLVPHALQSLLNSITQCVLKKQRWRRDVNGTSWGASSRKAFYTSSL